MIYGLEDNEFGLIEKPKFNKKKLIIIVSLITLLVLFISFKISYNSINKKNKDNQVLSSSSHENINSDSVQKKDDNNVEIIEKNTDPDYDDTVYNADASNVLLTTNENLNETENLHKQIPQHNLEEILSKVLPKPNENAQNIIKNIYKSDEKQVYLTFDDGPSKQITPQILDILKQYNVKATFFVLGSRVDLYPDTLNREYKEGHYIANHGYSHKYSSIYTSKDTVFEEYIACENSIKKALNNEEYNSYLFRFPGGSSGGPYKSVKAEARELLESYGIAYTNWNALTGDAENKKTKDECIKEMLNTKGNQNSIILLMHDANDKQQTVDALPEIIEYYKNEGYTFKNFYEIFK